MSLSIILFVELYPPSPKGCQGFGIAHPLKPLLFLSRIQSIHPTSATLLWSYYCNVTSHTINWVYDHNLKPCAGVLFVCRWIQGWDGGDQDLTCRLYPYLYRFMVLSMQKATYVHPSASWFWSYSLCQPKVQVIQYIQNLCMAPAPSLFICGQIAALGLRRRSKNMGFKLCSSLNPLGDFSTLLLSIPLT